MDNGFVPEEYLCLLLFRTIVISNHFAIPSRMRLLPQLESRSASFQLPWLYKEESLIKPSIAEVLTIRNAVKSKR